MNILMDLHKVVIVAAAVAVAAVIAAVIGVVVTVIVVTNYRMTTWIKLPRSIKIL